MSRFELQQHEDGQIYVSEGRTPMLHALLKGKHDVEVQIGVEGKVTVEKLYGPLVFMDVRVSCDFEACEWVIERGTADGGWKEWARVPGQLEEDFPGA